MEPALLLHPREGGTVRACEAIGWLIASSLRKLKERQ
jgi:hypothetical protein